MRSSPRAALALVVFAAAGCAGPSGMQRYVESHRLPQRIELADTPFYPQREYQCGPAALATVLTASGVAITADELVPEVYLPARKGSLQVEIAAVARKHGRLPYELAPSPAAMFGELEAGRPVLVLQKQGFGPWPAWHYAVLVGYDTARGQVFLRSGTDARKVLRASLFMSTWQRGGAWSLVLLEPGQLPVDADPVRYLRAAAGFEATGRYAEAEAAYAAAVRRWPDDAGAYLGLGNLAAVQGDWRGAERLFRSAVERAPDDASAHNNRAEALLRMNCPAAASVEIETARRLAAAGPLHGAVEATARAVNAAGSTDAADCPAAPAIPDQRPFRSKLPE